MLCKQLMNITTKNNSQSFSLSSFIHDVKFFYFINIYIEGGNSFFCSLSTNDLNLYSPFVRIKLPPSSSSSFLLPSFPQTPSRSILPSLLPSLPLPPPLLTGAREIGGDRQGRRTHELTPSLTHQQTTNNQYKKYKKQICSEHKSSRPAPRTNQTHQPQMPHQHQRPQGCGGGSHVGGDSSVGGVCAVRRGLQFGFGAVFKVSHTAASPTNCDGVWDCDSPAVIWRRRRKRRKRRRKRRRRRRASWI